MNDNMPQASVEETEQEYQVLGRPHRKVDAMDRLTGVAKYADDLTLPRMLHAKILRSPHAHARIVNIDTSKAEALTGVFAVATSRDFPCSSLGKSLDFIGATRGL